MSLIGKGDIYLLTCVWNCNTFRMNGNVYWQTLCDKEYLLRDGLGQQKQHNLFKDLEREKEIEKNKQCVVTSYHILDNVKLH